jgi:rubredoxin---NAD+ reductase
VAPVIIVGAGMAAYSLARALRKRDPAIDVLIVTSDAGAAYAKPLLSTAMASGKDASQLITASAMQMGESLDLRVLTHAPVRSIDRGAREIDTAAGRFRYGSLVLAVGADPIRLPLGGDAAEDIVSINHIADYMGLRRCLATAGAQARVAIIGAGLIGCELADDLLSGGHRVMLVDPNARPLAALAAPALSAALVEAWSRRAMDLYMGSVVVAAHRSGSTIALELENGGRIDADIVISAVGLRPAAALAAQAGLQTRRGIVVDAYGRTSDPDVYALGDCAEYAIGQGTVLPYVAPMLTAARAIAATLCEQPTTIAFKPEPIVVKTPSCKLALLPPPAGTAGEWRSNALDGRIVARFYDTDGIIRGFGLTEPTAILRQALVAELGMSLF